jgi:hypothetical protein
MSNLIIKILEDVNNHLFVYVFLVLAVIFGLLLGQGIVGLVLLSLGIGILIGQNISK